MSRTPGRVWNVFDLIEMGHHALAVGESTGAGLIDGRIISVMATPQDGSASKMSAGLSVLPSNYSTPSHSHEAEELAHILSGDGIISIDGIPYKVGPGDIVLTPSYAQHVTTVSAKGPMVIWWVYAPPGSEVRWLPPSTAGRKNVARSN